MQILRHRTLSLPTVNSVNSAIVYFCVPLIRRPQHSWPPNRYPAFRRWVDKNSSYLHSAIPLGANLGKLCRGLQGKRKLYVGRFAWAYDHGSKIFILMVNGRILEMNPASVFCM
jgi:hypothetical protein